MLHNASQINVPQSLESLLVHAFGQSLYLRQRQLRAAGASDIFHGRGAFPFVHPVPDCSYASANTVSVIQRLNPSLSMNCLNSSVSSFIIELITRTNA